ncbi:DUF5837 family cyanobactin class RiPP [Argonema antarcticum]|uniref:DUF5837 family cyanobactin class RiPP n=1 Tax=Argonema antarcticum TaxID=2942763 RepID=UPI002011D370|nr:DUF5837 family cyanobactin class RiPP [Argonema antarcticum]MCL1469848.1 DUF5837 family protein [Argonema antarcticum A004/B2]
MDHQNLMPIAAQPVNRITTGQLPSELAELSEEALSQLGEDASNSASVLASLGSGMCGCGMCSYDGDDAE